MPSRSNSNSSQRAQTKAQLKSKANAQAKQNGVEQELTPPNATHSDNAALLDALAAALAGDTSAPSASSAADSKEAEPTKASASLVADKDADKDAALATDAAEVAAVALASEDESYGGNDGAGAEAAGAAGADASFGADDALGGDAALETDVSLGAPALAEDEALLQDELDLGSAESSESWRGMPTSISAAAQLYHPGQEPCPPLQLRSDQPLSKEKVQELKHANGTKLDLSYIFPELSEFAQKCPDLAARLNNEFLSGSSQVFNQLILTRNLEQLGAKGLPDLNAGELRKLIAESLKSLSFSELDEYCQLFRGLPLARENELKARLQQGYEVFEQRLISELYELTQKLKFAHVPKPKLESAKGRQDWYTYIGRMAYRQDDFMVLHETMGGILTRIGKMVSAPTTLWLIYEFLPGELDLGVDLMRNMVFEAYAQYEEDIRLYLKNHPLTNPKELDEVIFYSYLLANKTHLESDYEQYEALVQLSNQLTLFKMLSGAFCHRSNFDQDLDNYCRRFVGKSALAGDYEPRDESDLASSSLNSGTIFKTQYRNVAEFKKLLPGVYGLHFCYLDSVLQLCLNGREEFELPCPKLRMHLYHLAYISSCIYVKKADLRAHLSAFDLNLGFHSPLYGYIISQDALALGRRALKEFAFQMHDADNATTFFKKILADIDKQSTFVNAMPEYRRIKELFQDKLAQHQAQGTFAPLLEKWALYLYIKQRILASVAPVGISLTAAAGNRLNQWTDDNLRSYLDIVCSYVNFCHNLIYKHFMAADYYLEHSSCNGGSTIADGKSKQREHVFLDIFTRCNARIGSSVTLYNEAGKVLSPEEIERRVNLGGAANSGGHFKTIKVNLLSNTGVKEGFDPNNYVPGLIECNAELCAAANALSQDLRQPYQNNGRAVGQLWGHFHTTDWTAELYEDFQGLNYSAYGELIGDNGMVALMPGTPAWSAYLIGRACYTGELIGVKHLHFGYALLSYADLSGCYEASSYLATMCQPLFLNNANDEGRLFLYQHLRALASYHLGRVACDFAHYRVRLFQSYERFIERHDLVTAIAQLLGQDPDLRRVVEFNNPTLASFNGGSSHGHVTSHGAHSIQIVNAALRVKGWDLGNWLELPAAAFNAAPLYSVRAYQKAHGFYIFGQGEFGTGEHALISDEEVRQQHGKKVKGLEIAGNADAWSDDWNPRLDENGGSSRVMRAVLLPQLKLNRELSKRLTEPYIPIDVMGTKGGIPLREISAWGVVLANTILVLCDFLTRSSFLATRYQVLIECLMEDLAEVMRREYSPDGCFAVYKYLITPLPQRKNHELSDPNFWITLLHGQLTGSGAHDSSLFAFYPENEGSGHNLEIAVMFLQLGMVLPEYREQGYALVADLIENTAGDLVPALMPYLDEYVRGAAAQQEGAALHYLTQAAKLRHDDTLADLLALMGSRAQDCRSFKEVVHYLVQHRLKGERRDLAQRLFFMQQPYGFYEQYLNLRAEPKEQAFAHSCLFYAAALQVPEAKVELLALEEAGKFKPLPFIIYLKYLQELAKTNLQARAVLMMLSVNGDILPPDFMSLYQLVEENQRTFSNSALKAELFKRGTMGPQNLKSVFNQRCSWVGLFAPEQETLEQNNKAINGNFAHWQGSVEMLDLETYAFLNFAFTDKKVQAVVRKLFESLSQGQSYLERLLTYNWLRSDLFPEFLQEPARQVKERINTLDSIHDYPAVICMLRLCANVMDLRFVDYDDNYAQALCTRSLDTDKNVQTINEVCTNLLNDGLMRPSYSQFLYAALYSLRELKQPNFALFRGFCRYLGNLGNSSAQRYGLLNYAHLSVAPYGEAFERSITRPHEDALRAAAPFLSQSLVQGTALSRLLAKLTQRRIDSGFTEMFFEDSAQDTALNDDAVTAAVAAHHQAKEQGSTEDSKDEAQVVSLATDSVKQGNSTFSSNDLVHSVLGAEGKKQEGAAALDFADLSEDARDLVDKLGLHDRTSTLARALGIRWRRHNDDGTTQVNWEQILPNGLSSAPLCYYLDQELPEELEIYLEVLIDSSYFLLNQCSSLYQLLLYCRNGWQLAHKPHAPKRSFASLMARDMMRGVPNSSENFLYYSQSHLFKYKFGRYLSNLEQAQDARCFMRDVFNLESYSKELNTIARKLAAKGFSEFSRLIDEKRNGLTPGKFRFLPEEIAERYNRHNGYINFYSEEDVMTLTDDDALKSREALRSLVTQLNYLWTLPAKTRRAIFEPSDDAIIAKFYEVNQKLSDKELRQAYAQLIETLKLRATIERILPPDDFERLMEQEDSDFICYSFSSMQKQSSLDELIGMLGYTCSIMPYAALQHLDKEGQTQVLAKSGLLSSQDNVADSELAQARLAIAQGQELWGFNYDRRERRWNQSAAELTLVASRTPSNYQEHISSYFSFGTTYINSSYQVAWLRLKLATSLHQEHKEDTLPSFTLDAWDGSSVGGSDVNGDDALGSLVRSVKSEEQVKKQAKSQEEQALLNAITQGQDYHGSLFNDELYYGYEHLSEYLTQVSLRYGLDALKGDELSSVSVAEAQLEGSEGVKLSHRLRVLRGKGALSQDRGVPEQSQDVGAAQAKLMAEIETLPGWSLERLAGSLEASFDARTSEVKLEGAELFLRVQGALKQKLETPQVLSGQGKHKFGLSDAFALYRDHTVFTFGDESEFNLLNEDTDGPGTYLRYFYLKQQDKDLGADLSREQQPCRPDMYFEDDSPLSTFMHLVLMRTVLDIDFDVRLQVEHNFLTILGNLGYYYGANDVIDSAITTLPYYAYLTRFKRDMVVDKIHSEHRDLSAVVLRNVFAKEKDIDLILSNDFEDCPKLTAQLARYLNLPENTPPFILEDIVHSCAYHLQTMQYSWYWQSLLSLNTSQCTPSRILYYLDDSMLHFAFYDWLAQPELLARAPLLQVDLTDDVVSLMSAQNLTNLMDFDRDYYQKLLHLSNQLGRALTYDEVKKLKAGTLKAEQLIAQNKSSGTKSRHRGLNHASKMSVRALKNWSSFSPLKEQFELFWLNFTRPEFLMRHRDPEIDPRLHSYLKHWYKCDKVDFYSYDMMELQSAETLELEHARDLIWSHACDHYSLARIYFPERLRSKMQTQWVGSIFSANNYIFKTQGGTCDAGKYLLSDDELAQTLCYPPLYCYYLTTGRTLSYGRDLELSEIERLTPLFFAGYDLLTHFVCDSFTFADPLKYFLDSVTVLDAADLRQYRGDMRKLARQLWGNTSYNYEPTSKLQLLLDQRYWEIFSRELRYNFDHNLPVTNFVDDLEVIRSTYRTKLWSYLNELKCNVMQEPVDYRYFLPSTLNQSLGLPTELDLSGEVALLRESHGLKATPETLLTKLRVPKDEGYYRARNKEQARARAYLMHPELLEQENELEYKTQMLQALTLEQEYLDSYRASLESARQGLAAELKGKGVILAEPTDNNANKGVLGRKELTLKPIPSRMMQEGKRLSKLQAELNAMRPEVLATDHAFKDLVDANSKELFERASYYGDESGENTKQLNRAQMQQQLSDDISFDEMLEVELAFPVGRNLEYMREGVDITTVADIAKERHQISVALNLEPARSKAQAEAQAKAKAQPQTDKQEPGLSRDQLADDGIFGSDSEEEFSPQELVALNDDEVYGQELDDDEIDMDERDFELERKFVESLLNHLVTELLMRGVDLHDKAAVMANIAQLRKQELLKQGFSSERVNRLVNSGFLTVDREYTIEEFASLIHQGADIFALATGLQGKAGPMKQRQEKTNKQQSRKTERSRRKQSRR